MPSTSRACAGRGCRSDRRLTAIDRNAPVSSIGTKNVPHGFSIFFWSEMPSRIRTRTRCYPWGRGGETVPRLRSAAALGAASAFIWAERSSTPTLGRSRPDVGARLRPPFDLEQGWSEKDALIGGTGPRLMSATKETGHVAALLSR